MRSIEIETTARRWQHHFLLQLHVAHRRAKPHMINRKPWIQSTGLALVILLTQIWANRDKHLGGPGKQSVYAFVLLVKSWGYGQ